MYNPRTVSLALFVYSTSQLVPLSLSQLNSGLTTVISIDLLVVVHSRSLNIADDNDDDDDDDVVTMPCHNFYNNTKHNNDGNFIDAGFLAFDIITLRVRILQPE